MFRKRKNRRLLFHRSILARTLILHLKSSSLSGRSSTLTQSTHLQSETQPLKTIGPNPQPQIHLLTFLPNSFHNGLQLSLHKPSLNATISGNLILNSSTQITSKIRINHTYVQHRSMLLNGTNKLCLLQPNKTSKLILLHFSNLLTSLLWCSLCTCRLTHT